MSAPSAQRLIGARADVVAAQPPEPVDGVAELATEADP